MSEIELKPCPFCGRDAKLCEPAHIGEHWHVATVECNGCFAQVIAAGNEIKTKEAAIESVIEAWNSRTIDIGKLSAIAQRLDTLGKASKVRLVDVSVLAAEIRKAVGE
jgi:Lar family restriction alleviation protein